MIKRNLGGSNLSVSAIGLGCMDEIAITCARYPEHIEKLTGKEQG